MHSAEALCSPSNPRSGQHRLSLKKAACSVGSVASSSLWGCWLLGFGFEELSPRNHRFPFGFVAFSVLSDFASAARIVVSSAVLRIWRRLCFGSITHLRRLSSFAVSWSSDAFDVRYYRHRCWYCLVWASLGVLWRWLIITGLLRVNICGQWSDRSQLWMLPFEWAVRRSSWTSSASRQPSTSTSNSTWSNTLTLGRSSSASASHQASFLPAFELTQVMVVAVALASG